MPKKNIKIVFCDTGLVLGKEGKYFQPKRTEAIEGFVELEVPESPEIQFYGPECGLQKIFVGHVDVVTLFDESIHVKPYQRLNEFELRVLSLAIKKELKVDFDEAKQVLSLQDVKWWRKL